MATAGGRFDGGRFAGSRFNGGRFGERSGVSLAAIIAVLFGNGEQGFVNDLSDMSTLFQDSVGATPVTDYGQTVGMVLDKSQGLVLGPELVTNGGFASGAGWTAGTNWAIGSGVATKTAGAAGNLEQTTTSVTNKSYRVEFDLALSAGGFTPFFGGSSGAFVNTSGRVSQVIVSADASGLLRINGNTASAGSIDNISVRELPGHHATQSNAASRPVYGREPFGGRRNLLNATATLSTQSATVTAAQHTLSFKGTGTVTLSGASTAGPLVGTGASNTVSLSFTPSAGSLTLTVSGSVTEAQLELGASRSGYQAVVSQWDITEAGVPTVYYLQSDGSDDWLVTPTITPGTDKAQVFVGVRKLSDAAVTCITELSATTVSNNGASILYQPASAGWGFSSKGTTVRNANTPSTFTAPRTDVLTALGDISGPSVAIRVNGTQEAVDVSSQGTGNYLAYPAYIFRRGGTSLPFNGRLYGYPILRFGSNLDAATIEKVETLIAKGTGVTL